jgi:hypothetical protein
MYGGGFRLKKTLPPTLRAITHLVRCNKGCHDDVSIKKGLELVGCDVEQHLPAAENKYWLRDQLGENENVRKIAGKSRVMADNDFSELCLHGCDSARDYTQLSNLLNQ